jgi:hypothetical protein
MEAAPEEVNGEMEEEALEYPYEEPEEEVEEVVVEDIEPEGDVLKEVVPVRERPTGAKPAPVPVAKPKPKLTPGTPGKITTQEPGNPGTSGGEVTATPTKGTGATEGEQDVEIELIEEEATIQNSQESAETVEMEQESTDDYTVSISTRDTMFLEQEYVIKVWIGKELKNLSLTDDMVSNQKEIDATLGNYAKVIPFFPGFEIKEEPNSCFKIVPSGSTVKFRVVPLTRGPKEISAVVQIFERNGCAGDFAPKETAYLPITVEVDIKRNFTDMLFEMGDVLWTGFLKFWQGIVVLFFGLLLYLIRRKVKKKTNYGGTPEDNV